MWILCFPIVGFTIPYLWFHYRSHQPFIVLRTSTANLQQGVAGTGIKYFIPLYDLSNFDTWASLWQEKPYPLIVFSVIYWFQRIFLKFAHDHALIWIGRFIVSQLTGRSHRRRRMTTCYHAPPIKKEPRYEPHQESFLPFITIKQGMSLPLHLWKRGGIWNVIQEGGVIQGARIWKTATVSSGKGKSNLADRIGQGTGKMPSPWPHSTSWKILPPQRASPSVRIPHLFLYIGDICL